VSRVLRNPVYAGWMQSGGELFEGEQQALVERAPLDAAFDRGFIPVAGDGAIVVSGALDADACATLGLDRPLRVCGLADGHRAYLPWHRERIFRKSRG
jgi:hypothetical protein